MCHGHPMMSGWPPAVWTTPLSFGMLANSQVDDIHHLFSVGQFRIQHGVKVLFIQKGSSHQLVNPVFPRNGYMSARTHWFGKRAHVGSSGEVHCIPG